MFIYPTLGGYFYFDSIESLTSHTYVDILFFIAVKLDSHCVNATLIEAEPGR